MANIHPRLPTLGLTILSIILNIAILACAAHTLHTFRANQHTNAYFLPVWNEHFDNRQLSALIGTSVVVALLNIVMAAAQFVKMLPANTIGLVASSLSSIVVLIAISFSSVLDHRAPVRDTLMTWTCRWRAIPDARMEGVPREFDTMCHETRFAFYTAIPSFILQLLLVGLALYAIRTAPSPHSRGFAGEKDHELGQVRAWSSDSKNGSINSPPTSIRVSTKQ